MEHGRAPVGVERIYEDQNIGDRVQEALRALRRGQEGGSLRGGLRREVEKMEKIDENAAVNGRVPLAGEIVEPIAEAGEDAN